MSTPLRIPTPEGSGQAVHPDVVDTVTGFAGHRYWMACTPYPFGEDRAENPVIRVSDDGLRWNVVAGAPDPLVPAPAAPEEHWSDTDLVLADGRLHVFFRGCVRGLSQAQFWLTTSTDGIGWSPPEQVWAGDRGVSPSVVATPEGWVMWHLEADSRWMDRPSRLVRTTGASPQSLTESQEGRLLIPGHVPWHLDVVSTDLGYEALVAAYPRRANASRCRLFHLVSSNGLDFTLSQPRPVLAPSALGWDSRAIYRSSFTKDSQSTYRVWYSGCAWDKRWGTGMAVGPISALTRVPGTSDGPRSGLGAQAGGAASYVAQYRLPGPVKSTLRRALTVLPRR